MRLSMSALKERANEVASNELMNSVKGGLLNDCHDDVIIIKTEPVRCHRI